MSIFSCQSGPHHVDEGEHRLLVTPARPLETMLDSRFAVSVEVWLAKDELLAFFMHEKLGMKCPR